MGLREACRGRSIYRSCHRESQSLLSVDMMVVLENELERKLSVGPGLIVDKTTLVPVKHTIHHCNTRKLSPQDCDTPVALQNAISEYLSTPPSIFNL